MLFVCFPAIRIRLHIFPGIPPKPRRISTEKSAFNLGSDAMPRFSSEELLSLARAGDRNALGHLLDQFRDMLRGRAQQELSSRIQVRVAPSDLVQATFLDAYRDLENFRGTELAQFIAWLQQILHHNVLQSVEMHKLTQKRSINRETPLDDSAKNGEGKRNQLAGDQSTPSQQARRKERAEQLLSAMEALPAEQKAAAEMRFLEGRSIDQIAKSLGKSKTAAAGLLKRGIQNLRQTLPDDQE